MPARKPVLTTPPVPERAGTRPIREVLHESLNANTVRMVREGLRGIDLKAAEAKKHLNRQGLTDINEIVDSAADLVKRLLVRGISK